MTLSSEPIDVNHAVTNFLLVPYPKTTELGGI